MDFKTSVTICLKEKYKDFEGRASRSEYWYFMLFYFILYFVANILTVILPEILGLIILLVVTFGLFVPVIAVTARRLHDTNRSGWLQLLILIPIVGALILLYFYIQKGTDGENKYGSPSI